jgi:hypothetical protein
MPARRRGRAARAAKTKLDKTANVSEDDGVCSNDQQSQESLFSSCGETDTVNVMRSTRITPLLAQQRLTSTDECESMEVSQEDSMEDDRRPASHWTGWTEDQLKVLNEHLNYKIDILGRLQEEIKQINRAWANGPIDFVKQNTVKKPTSQLDSLMYKSKPEKKKASDMTAEQIIHFLKQRKGNVQFDQPLSAFNIQLADSLDSVATKLRQKYQQLLKKENDVLNERIQLGIMLHGARKVFRKQRKAKSIPGTWNEWITSNTQICKSYANKCIAVGTFVEQYPILRTLNICFTELYKILRKIKIVFAENPELADEWKTAP